MKLHKLENPILGEYIAIKFPHQYVVVVRSAVLDYNPETPGFDISLEMDDYVKTVLVEKYGLDLVDVTNMLVGEGRVILVCDTEKEAWELFEQFPEGKAGYTLIFEKGEVVSENT